MIKFKQKEWLELENRMYSSKLTRAIYGIRKATAPLRSKVAQAGVDVFGSKEPAAQLTNNIMKKDVAKSFSPMAQKRAAIRNTKTIEKAAKETETAIKNPKLTATRTGVKAMEAAKKGKNIINTAAINPGVATNEAVAKVAENPIQAVGRAGGVVANIAYPVTNAVPIGSGSMFLEQGIKKLSPKYAELTKRAGNSYRRSRLSDYVSGAVNGAVNSARML